MKSSASEQVGIPRGQIIAGFVLSGLPALAFGPSAFMKIVQPGDFLAQWTKGYPAGAARPLGILEITSYALYLVPRTRVLGCMLLTAYLGGAVATHLHAQDGFFFIPVIMGIILWAGLYLRDNRLRQLMPLVQR